jgi:hypothetical protein
MDARQHPQPGDNGQEQGSSGGLNLSALHDEHPPTGSPRAVQDALARQFMEEIDAQFGTIAEPGGRRCSGSPGTGGGGAHSVGHLPSLPLHAAP